MVRTKPLAGANCCVSATTLPAGEGGRLLARESMPAFAESLGDSVNQSATPFFSFKACTCAQDVILAPHATLARACGPCGSFPQNRPGFLWKRSLINIRVMDLMEVGRSRRTTLYQHQPIPKTSSGWMGDEPGNGLSFDFLSILYRISGSSDLRVSCDRPVNRFRHDGGRSSDHWLLSRSTQTYHTLLPPSR